MTTHFTFLQPEWPAIFEAATKAEAAAFPDPRTACFHARQALELAVAWLYKHDPALTPSLLNELRQRGICYCKPSEGS